MKVSITFPKTTDSGNKVTIIRTLRNIVNMDLKTAKETVEAGGTQEFTLINHAPEMFIAVNQHLHGPALVDAYHSGMFKILRNNGCTVTEIGNHIKDQLKQVLRAAIVEEDYELAKDLIEILQRQAQR